jgi:transposase
MWLTGRLSPDFKTIADFRKDNAEAIRALKVDLSVWCYTKSR